MELAVPPATARVTQRPPPLQEARSLQSVPAPPGPAFQNLTLQDI